MQAIGGLFELSLLAMAGVSVMYFIVEPLICWLVVGVALLFGFGRGK